MSFLGPILHSDADRRFIWGRVEVDDLAEDAAYAFASENWGTPIVESLFLSSQKMAHLGLVGHPTWTIGIELTAREWERFQAGQFDGVRVRIEGEMVS